MDLASKLWEAIMKVSNENNIPLNDFDNLGIVASLAPSILRQHP